MALFDWIVLAIAASACYLGMKRGFLGAALNLCAWIAAIFLSFAFGDLAVAVLMAGLSAKIEAWLAASPLAAEIFRGPEAADSIVLWSARLGILVAVLLLGTTLSGLVSRAVENSMFDSANRALGLLLGAAKGWILAGGLLLLLTHVGPDSWVRGSMSAGLLQPASDALDALLGYLGGQ